MSKFPIFWPLKQLLIARVYQLWSNPCRCTFLSRFLIRANKGKKNTVQSIEIVPRGGPPIFRLMLMNSRGGPPFGGLYVLINYQGGPPSSWWNLEADPPFMGCMFINSRGGSHFFKGESASRDTFYNLYIDHRVQGFSFQIYGSWSQRAIKNCMIYKLMNYRLTLQSNTF